MARVIILALLLAGACANPDAPPAEDATANVGSEAAAVDNGALDEARAQIAQLQQAAEASQSELLALKDMSKQHQEKAELLQKQLEKTESAANKYREQTSTLNQELQELKLLNLDMKKQMSEHAEKLAAAQEGMAKAENQQKASMDDIETEFTEKLKVAEQAANQARAELATSKKTTETLKALLESSDVQYYIQLRDLTSDSAEYATQKSSEMLGSASEVLHENYDIAWQEAHKLAAQASPVAEDLHKQFVEQGTPLIEQARIQLDEGIIGSRAAIEEVLHGIDATKPYAKDAAYWIVAVTAGLPLFLVLFMIFRLVMSLAASLLLKLQYAGVFFMLGAVLTTHSLALATNSDPISRLRETQPELYSSVHVVLAVVAASLSFLHFVTLLVRENGGKTIKAQFCSMIAAVLVVVVFCHYYFMVYLERSNPTFEIKLNYSPDGHPSYVEYSIFFAALMLFTGLGLPHSFRFTARAVYTALESAFGGALVVLTVFSAVEPASFAQAHSLHHFKWACASLALVLVALLGYRFIRKVQKGPIGGSFALVHLLIVCRILWVVKDMVLNHKPVGGNLQYAAAGFLFTTVVHMFWVTFGKESKEDLSKRVVVSSKQARTQAKKGKK